MKVIILGSLNYCPPESRYIPYIPLGPLSCAAVLEEKGWQVEVLDPNLLVTSGAVDKESLYDDLASSVCNRKPDLIGFSTFSNSYHQSLRIAERVKALDKRIVKVFGGPQASVLDSATLSHFPQVDIVVRGEGEGTFASLVERISAGSGLSGLRGITHRIGGIIRKEDDAPLVGHLDELPLPAYHLYPMEAHRVVPLDVGRGCPFSCSFCSTCHFWKRRHRVKSPGRIIREIKHLIDRFGCRIFEIPHDLFTFDRELVMTFIGLLESEKLDITWSCFGRVDCMDADLLRVMARSGCTAIGYGIESGSSGIQHDMGKNLKPEKIHAVIRDSLDAGLTVVTSFIMGFPEEREEDLTMTLAMMMEIMCLARQKVSLGCALLIPYAGSQIHDAHQHRLVYNGYRPARKPGTPYDRESILLIRRHPGIFSDHFHCAMQFLKRDMLEELLELMMIPGSTVPASTIVLWEARRGDPLSLYREWRTYNSSLEPSHRYRRSPLRGDNHHSFVSFFRAFVRHLLDTDHALPQYLTELIDYETTMYLMRTGRGTLPSGYLADLFGRIWDDEQFLALRPRRERKLLVRSYTFDVKAFAGHIMAGGSLEGPERSPCIFALWQSFPGLADSLRLDGHSTQLLALCNGRRSVADIVAAPLEGDPESEMTKGTLRDLFRLGLVRFEEAFSSAMHKRKIIPVSEAPCKGAGRRRL
jgi:radical SAM superfamily enzyme YgiQ (UPF0313 family)